MKRNCREKIHEDEHAAPVRSSADDRPGRRQHPIDGAALSIQRELFDEAGSLSNAWADFDKDGDLVFAVTMKSGAIHLYRNDNRSFVSIGEAVGLPVSGGEFRAISWGDYDGDGDLDIYATDRMGKNRLYRNDGGAFSQILAAAGPAIFKSTVGACWLDYDEDDDLDLFLPNQSAKQIPFIATMAAPSRMLRLQSAWTCPDVRRMKGE